MTVVDSDDGPRPDPGGPAWSTAGPGTAAATADPWQERLDRLRRVAPLPLLALSTVAAYVVPSSSHRPWTLVPLGVPLVVATAALWTVVTARPRAADPGRPRNVLFTVHTVLAAVLVGVSPVFGVFAYTGFLYAYGLGRRLRAAGFVVTALIVSAATVGDYPRDPFGEPGQAAGFLVVAVVFTALTLNSSWITGRAVAQNRERGEIIAELAEANRRLAASTTENAGLQTRLLTQAREAGVVAERQRLAGEIHDTLAQDLAGIVRQLDAADEQRDRTGDWSRHVDNARTLARSALTEARRSVRALSPAALERDGLPGALRTLAGSTGRLAGVEVTVSTPDAAGLPRLPPDVETALFRVAQEALANVVRHAAASRVQVTLTVTGPTLLLDVVDDGAGFDPARPVDGYGLAGMRERLAGIGGTLTVDAAPGAGTSLNASVALA